MAIFCNRLTNMIRVNTTGHVLPCCLMTNAPSFFSAKEMKESQWLVDTIDKFKNDQWPDECSICKNYELNGETSIRQHSIKKHSIFEKINKNYTILDIAPNNICNAACLTCDSRSSSFYAKTFGMPLLTSANFDEILSLMTDQVLQIDFSGGDPLYSKLLDKMAPHVPSSVKKIRVNTNGSTYFDFSKLLEKQIIVELTLSIDAIGPLFDYIRWPLTFDNVDKNLQQWIEQRKQFPKLQIAINTVVSALNIAKLSSIEKYAKEKNIGYYYNFLRNPDVLDIKYKNFMTKNATSITHKLPVGVDKDNTNELLAWLEKNDRARGISYKNYYGD